MNNIAFMYDIDLQVSIDNKFVGNVWFTSFLYDNILNNLCSCTFEQMYADFADAE